ncbi:hypothetical protein Pmar_PMAR023146 [Perkinsus marinus ATCC 50983]|uniref:Integrase catalytic domain-containing protein n=1 Tax=Perkinsus marinus (strain ATCC 50983 / TXsc) TaxID=423536 RepID=C5M0X5_PERM5|nr:hypothetical protein Pmar_PMAR023146 [Perkinsus marinus ATCC 50983]EEQ97367.1 hypothetical protein Pmar_PMAR023146 [Perkinsus marinus ATCC 50983]|eukprot:XP_002764650.1 hypothetical protein Pmar_PMAR023146 [Perkinsus marinus ATCC 50983]
MTDAVFFHVLFDVLDNPNTGAVVDPVHKIIAMNGIPQAVVPGSCFPSSDFKMYLKSQAIAYTYLPRDAQHLGGFHERVHGTILQQVRGRLARAELQAEPITFLTIYSEAVASVNRLPLTDSGGLTPFELYHGRRPRYLAGSCTGEDARLGQQLIDEWFPGLRRNEQDVLESDEQESGWQGPYIVTWKNQDGTLYRLKGEDGTSLPYVEGRSNLRKYYERDEQDDLPPYDSYDENGVFPPDDVEVEHDVPIEDADVTN